MLAVHRRTLVSLTRRRRFFAGPMEAGAVRPQKPIENFWRLDSRLSRWRNILKLSGSLRPKQAENQNLDDIMIIKEQ